MTPVVYAVKTETPVNSDIFRFLLGFVRAEKSERILRQKVKQNADEMLMGEILAMSAIKNVFQIPFSRQIIIEDSFGKPYLRDFPNIHFNISHCSGFVVCAVCDKPVGVDVQQITPFLLPVAKRICNEKELLQISESKNADSDFTKLWTMKEAALKLKGTGIAKGDFKSCLEGVYTESKKTDGFWITVCSEKFF